MLFGLIIVLMISTCFGGCFAEKKTLNKGCQSQLTQLLPEKKVRKILVFVSFSMPEVSLKILAQEAEKYGAVLVMRGLYEDSFVKTTLKLQNISIDINPELFEKHHVTVVPTFISIQNGQEMQRLSGNVTLSFCAQLFEEAR